MKTQKFKLFISTAHIDPKDEQDNTGDIDYAKAIYEETDKLLPEQVFRITGLFNEQEIYEYIEKHADIEPILHVMINPPRTGMAFSSEGLMAFKEKHKVKIIVTAIEFAKLINNKDSDVDISNALKILSVADQIIFLDAHDKDSAYIYAPAILKTKIQQASIIPVLPTIEQKATISLKSREKNIISFGMIRVGKGLGLVILLAKMLKQKNITDKKVLVVGTVQDNAGGAKELRRLMLALYPTKTSEITSQTTTAGLKKLLSNYKSDPSSITELPMEIHVDVPKDELAPLFNRCTYAFLPAYRGATFRNSSISSCLAQRFIIYSHKDTITPLELLDEGVYAKSLALFSSFNGDNGQNYVDWVLQNILERDQNPALNIESLEAIEKLMSEKFSRSVIGNQHVSLYSGNSCAIEDSMRTERRFFGLWYAHFQKERAYKQFKQVHSINIAEQAKKNWSNLLKRLGKLEPEEVRFFDTLMDSDWYLTHATDVFSAIQDSGYKLLSLQERARKDPKMAANRNTSPFEGNDDNVFFAFGPGKVSSPEFLKYAKHVIEVDFNSGFIEEASSLHGLWSSGHIFAFGTQQDSTPVNFYGTVFSIRYRKVDQKSQDIAKNFKKIFRFEYEDKSVKEQEIGVADEIFDGKHLKQALILMTIEKVRLLGQKAWEKIMREKTLLEEQQQIVKDLFHVGVFEIHKPAVFPLKQSFVVVNQLPDKSESLGAYRSSAQLIQAIEANDQHQAQQQVDLGASIDEYEYLYQYLDINALTAALFAGNTNMVLWCLDKGITIFKPNDCNLRTKNGHNIIQNSITEVIALGSPDASIWIGPSAVQNSNLFREYLDLLLRHGTMVPNNIHSRVCAVITQQDIIQAIQIFKLSEDDLCYLVERAVSIHPNKLPIVIAIKSGYVKLVAQMLKMGTDVNRCNDTCQLLEMKNLPNPLEGITPLVQAILIENVEMVELLLEHKVDVNLAYTCQDLSSRIAELEGHTPLAIAKTKTSESAKKIIQLLEEHGATVEQKSSWKNLPTSQSITKFLTMAIVCIIKDDTGEPCVMLEIDKKKVASLKEDSVGTIIDFEQLLKEENLLGISRDDLDYGFLMECSFATEADTFYGHQLYYVKLPTKLLKMIEQTDELCVVKLKELSNLTSLFTTSPYVKSVLTALQKNIANDGSYTLDESKIVEIKENWITEKQKLLKLKQAIEEKDPDGISAYLLEQENSDLDDVCFYGDFPVGIQRTSTKQVRAIDLAMYYENVDCIFILLKNLIEKKLNNVISVSEISSSDLYRYEEYISKCIELSYKQNNTKLLDLFNTNDKYKTIFTQYMLKNQHYITNTINTWIEVYSSKNVEDWFLQYKQEQQSQISNSIQSIQSPRLLM